MRYPALTEARNIGEIEECVCGVCGTTLDATRLSQQVGMPATGGEMEPNDVLP